MQSSETWLEQFNKASLSRSWDFTAVHIYKPDMAGVQADLDHYWTTYQKPIWVTEFACVNDVGGFVGCSDQGTVNTWIQNVVDLFEKNEHVMAYGYTDDGGTGGLGPVWSPSANGALTESGQTYLSAISKYS